LTFDDFEFLCGGGVVWLCGSERKIWLLQSADRILEATDILSYTYGSSHSIWILKIINVNKFLNDSMVFAAMLIDYF
jgi:hypothetical protein